MKVHVVRIEWRSGCTDVAVFRCPHEAAKYVITEANAELQDNDEPEVTTLESAMDSLGDADNYVYIDECEVQ